MGKATDARLAPLGVRNVDRRQTPCKGVIYIYVYIYRYIYIEIETDIDR